MASKKVIAIEYRLSLAKGSVNKVLGLERLLAGIEQQVFKGVEWIRIEESLPTLLGKMKSQGAYGEKIVLVFRVSSSEVIGAPKIWADALQRQCESWLFECELQTQEIKEG